MSPGVVEAVFFLVPYYHGEGCLGFGFFLILGLAEMLSVGVAVAVAVVRDDGREE